MRKNTANKTALICALIITAAACGSNASDSSSNAEPNAGASSANTGGGSEFKATPVQLTVDPCTLVTAAEVEALIGPVNPTPGVGSDELTCVRVSSKNTGGQLAVTLQSPDLCKLLFLALDEDFFGGKQVRVDDVGSGGMQVQGNGNVQFVVKGGCVEVSGTVTYDQKIDDATILQIAKTAVGRVS